MPGVRETSLDYRRPYRPLPVALANHAGRILERAGIRADLQLEALLGRARRATGLDDFGDPSFREPLAVLLRALEREAQLHPLGRLMVQQNLVRQLANRLRIERALARHPEIRQLPIERPIFIAGLQRTGTTLLHRLLAADPALRHLASWEAVNPAPLPRGRRGGPDPRIRAARLAERALAYLAPDFFAIHPVEATAPEEDCLLFESCFESQVPEATLRVPSYAHWLEQRDQLPAYRYYADVLRYLSWQRPAARWVLKTPQHLEHLDALFTVFPDATVIQTHRDPLKVIASFCSMMAHGRGVFSDVVDPVEVGQHWSRKIERMLRRGLAARDGRTAGALIDVRYADLVADPLAEVQRVYRSLEQPLTPAAVAAMEAWRATNPQHKHGHHRYRLQDFGLDQQQLRRLFADYCARFAIPSE